MKKGLTNTRIHWKFLAGLLTGAAVLAMPNAVAAQQAASNNVQSEREAMRKLAFLVGRWSGPVTIVGGPEPLHLTQSEDVQYKLDGLVMLIEGKSTGPEGKAQFQALATIACDDATHAYRFRAYHDGHYVDTELTVLADGFSWGFAAGPAHIVNTMHLTSKGEWQEASEVTVGNNPPHPNVNMLLQHQP